MNAQAETQTIAIILRIASDKAVEFEAMFKAEELPIWDDYNARGLFLECSLTRVAGGSQMAEGVQDYILHIIATPQGHDQHDDDPRFASFLERARTLQPAEPLVWFGEQIFERRG